MFEFITNNFTAISSFARVIATVGIAYYSKIDEIKLTQVNYLLYINLIDFHFLILSLKLWKCHSMQLNRIESI